MCILSSVLLSHCAMCVLLTFSAKSVGKLNCSLCERMLPERNFRFHQKSKGDRRKCERCVRRNPVFTDRRRR